MISFKSTSSTSSTVTAGNKRFNLEKTPFFRHTVFEDYVADEEFRRYVAAWNLKNPDNKKKEVTFLGQIAIKTMKHAAVDTSCNARILSLIQEVPELQPAFVGSHRAG
jgi:hypothetical protein